MGTGSSKLRNKQPAGAIAESRHSPEQANLLTIACHRQGQLPLSGQLAFLEDALSSFVEGGRYLISGPPGSLKSRLATQLGLDLGRSGIKSVFILTEEPAAKLKQRAVQMTSEWDRADAERALSNVQLTTGVYDVGSLPAWVTREVLSPAGGHHGAKLVVLDSIQGHGLSGAATKTYAKVAEFAQLCAENNITVVLICHVTKRNDVAGPRSLEHSIDASVVLRQAMTHVMLWTKKNRFGPLLRRPVHLRPDPLTTWLAPSPFSETQPTSARAYVGNLVEIQAAVTVPMEGRGRITAPGLPKKEIEQLIACISQVPGLDIQDLSYAVHCRVPAVAQYHPIFGLALSMSLISSFLRRPVPASGIYIGEVDLFRRVRRIPPVMAGRLKANLEADEIAAPATLFMAADTTADLPELMQGIDVVPCRTLDDAILNTWPDLR